MADAVNMYGIVQEVGLVLWKLIEVQPSTRCVAFEEVCGGRVVNTVVVEKRDVEAHVSKYCYECLRDFDTWPLDGGVRARDPADFMIFTEEIVIVSSSCASASAMLVMRMSMNSSGGA